ncbi:MAG: helix-turn-helix transcriptional regulator [Cyclobacteriaceae bacterium]
MNSTKRKRLEAKGFKVGNVQEFLNLSPEEAAYIELKLVLSKNLQDYRKARRLTQTELARRIKSSQSRVAKMESGDPSVSIDLLIRSLFALGASKKRLAGMLV